MLSLRALGKTPVLPLPFLVIATILSILPFGLWAHLPSHMALSRSVFTSSSRVHVYSCAQIFPLIRMQPHWVRAHPNDLILI